MVIDEPVTPVWVAPEALPGPHGDARSPNDEVVFAVVPVEPSPSDDAERPLLHAAATRPRIITTATSRRRVVPIRVVPLVVLDVRDTVEDRRRDGCHLRTLRLECPRRE